eukprot:CAMPEP_0177719410 /NCGR_PEP_ID=MMETSP0484_2-20121128/16087_1 /TAXON_ID=354590 /ORGANISM="Rhodomonas lens, Strain RHODO" /LENGTH=141 /DNA_ID=CAMNT_0019231623 /DNA_START=256 /DNA_END=677 /DNA_ORIENTATION=-
MTQRAFGHRRPGHFGEPLNYADTATAYHSTDIPEDAIIAKKQALHFLNPDILGLEEEAMEQLNDAWRAVPRGQRPAPQRDAVCATVSGPLPEADAGDWNINQGGGGLPGGEAAEAGPDHADQDVEAAVRPAEAAGRQGAGE